MPPEALKKAPPRIDKIKLTQELRCPHCEAWVKGVFHMNGPGWPAMDEAWKLHVEACATRQVKAEEESR